MFLKGENKKIKKKKKKKKTLIKVYQERKFIDSVIRYFVTKTPARIGER